MASGKTQNTNEKMMTRSIVVTRDFGAVDCDPLPLTLLTPPFDEALPPDGFDFRCLRVLLFS